VYGVAAAILGAIFAWYAIEVRRTLERRAAVRLFHYSLLYLALLFVAMAIDSIL
jgi:protoheme IX farnesyltransferase